MILTFDTSILIDIERRNKKTISIIKDLIKKYPGPAYLVFIPYFEFNFGIIKRSPKNFDKAYSFLQKFPLLTPTKKTAEILAELRKKYDKKGKVLPLADYLIASQVKEHNLILLTKDKDFEIFKEIKKIII